MLYQCPDCKGKVSSDAPACPHCGKPIAAIIAADAEMKAREAEKAAETAAEREKKREAALSLFKKKKWLLPSVLGAAAVIITLVLILSFACGKLSFTKVGSYVTYGTYQQTAEGNDNTPIEWLVLDYDEENNKVLLISRYGLNCQPYNTEWADVTWETCSLRTWLNGAFLNKAFSKAEQGAIQTTDVDNSSSQCYSGYSTSGGNNTKDKIFLLSYAEANKYFNVQHYSVSGAEENTKSRVEPTAYAIAQGAYTYSGDKTAEGSASGGWWLRSPGDDQHYAACVDTEGSMCNGHVEDDSLSVRPAVWLDLSGI